MYVLNHFVNERRTQNSRFPVALRPKGSGEFIGFETFVSFWEYNVCGHGYTRADIGFS